MITIATIAIALFMGLVLRSLVAACGTSAKREVHTTPARRAGAFDPIANHRPNCGCVGHR